MRLGTLSLLLRLRLARPYTFGLGRAFCVYLHILHTRPDTRNQLSPDVGNCCLLLAVARPG